LFYNFVGGIFESVFDHDIMNPKNINSVESELKLKYK